MSPARIPEGSVFVPRRRDRNVALQLLDAAEEVGADRVASVRTTTGGYFVFQEVADQYQANLDLPAEEVDETVAGGVADATGDANSDDANSDDANSDEDDSDEDEDDEDELAPLPVTAASTGKEIDEYAAGLTPPVDVSKAANKAEKIEILEAARQPKTAPDAE